jgi:hypothetical protein
MRREVSNADELRSIIGKPDDYVANQVKDRLSRADGYLNVLQRPYVGTLFLIPGRGDTLRLNQPHGHNDQLLTRTARV